MEYWVLWGFFVNGFLSLAFCVSVGFCFVFVGLVWWCVLWVFFFFNMGNPGVFLDLL